MDKKILLIYIFWLIFPAIIYLAFPFLGLQTYYPFQIAIIKFFSQYNAITANPLAGIEHSEFVLILAMSLIPGILVAVSRKYRYFVLTGGVIIGILLAILSYIETHQECLGFACIGIDIISVFTYYYWMVLVVLIPLAWELLKQNQNFKQLLLKTLIPSLLLSTSIWAIFSISSQSSIQNEIQREQKWHAETEQQKIKLKYELPTYLPSKVRSKVIEQFTTTLGPFASEGIRTVYRCQGGRDGYEFKILQGSKSPKLMSLDEIEKDLWQSKSHNESITVERVILKKGSGIFNQFKYLNGSGQIIDNEKATEGRLILDTTEKRFVLTISGYCLYDNSKAKEELIQTANSLSSFK